MGPYICFKEAAIEKELKKICEEVNRVRVEMFPTPPTVAVAYDQFGQPPITDTRYGHPMPCWRPPGYYIILQAPTMFDLRSVWPGVSTSTQSAADVQMLFELTMATAVGPVTA